MTGSGQRPSKDQISLPAAVGLLALIVALLVIAPLVRQTGLRLGVLPQSATSMTLWSLGLLLVGLVRWGVGTGRGRIGRVVVVVLSALCALCLPLAVWISVVALTQYAGSFRNNPIWFSALAVALLGWITWRGLQKWSTKLQRSRSGKSRGSQTDRDVNYFA